MSEKTVSERATIYCKYHTFYWAAHCRVGEINYETSSRFHGSARQAADEILARVRAGTGNAAVTMRRIYPKQYEVML